MLFKDYNRLSIFFIRYDNGKFKSWRKKGKDIRNLFRLEKEINYTAIRDVRNIFRLEKETKAVKDRILRDIKNLFEHGKEEENYYKPVRVTTFWNKLYWIRK